MLPQAPLREECSREGWLRQGVLPQAPLREDCSREGTLREGWLRQGMLPQAPLRERVLPQAPLREDCSREGWLRGGTLREGWLREGWLRQGMLPQAPLREVWLQRAAHQFVLDSPSIVFASSSGLLKSLGWNVPTRTPRSMPYIREHRVLSKSKDESTTSTVMPSCVAVSSAFATSSTLAGIRPSVGSSTISSFGRSAMPRASASIFC